jgi:hypothetical protein
MPSAFVNVLGRAVPHALYGVTRHWAGDRVADELQLPDNAFKHLIPALRPVVRFSERARRAGLRDDRRIAERTLETFKGVLEAGNAPPLVALEDAGKSVALAA